MTDDRDEERKARLRAAINRYLEQCPLAGDTPAGIAACWLPSHGYEDTLQFLAEVVDAMVAAGELVPRLLPDGRLLYVRGPAL